MKRARRRAATTVKAVRQMEESLGVPLKPVKGGLYLAVLPKDHPTAIATGDTRILLKIVDDDASPEELCQFVEDTE